PTRRTAKVEPRLMRKPAAPPSLDRLEKLCLEKGLRMTDQRRVIARVLSEAIDHPDVDQVYRRASAIDPHISIATVYRTVRLLDERAGPRQVRLAETWDEVDAALALRYRVFFDEMKANATPGIVAKQRDVDEFDPYCDHLLVIDNALGTGPEAVVGTYRML